MTDDTVVPLRPTASEETRQQVATLIPGATDAFDRQQFLDTLPDILVEVTALLLSDAGYNNSPSNTDTAIRLLTACIDRLGVDE